MVANLKRVICWDPYLETSLLNHHVVCKSFPLFSSHIQGSMYDIFVVELNMVVNERTTRDVFICEGLTCKFTQLNY